MQSRGGTDNVALVLAISCILIVCGCGDNEGRDVSDVSGNPSDGSDENGQSDVYCIWLK